MPNEQDVIKDIEDALKAIDGSNLPPAPASEGTEHMLLTRRELRESSSPVIGTPAGTIQKQQRTGISGRIGNFGRTKTPESNTSGNNIPGKNTPGNNNPVKKKNDYSINRAYPSQLHGADINDDDNAEELDTGPADFKVKFDFESAYRDVPENKPLRLRREKRTGLIGGLLLAVFIICVSVVLASIAWIAVIDVLGFNSVDEEVNVQIPSGFTLDGVADILYETGLIQHRALFILYAEYSNAVDKISEGSYILNKNYDYRALVQGMTARAGVRVEVTVTIPEGFTLAQIFSLLETEQVCSAADLWDAAANHHFDFHFLDEDTLGDRLRLEGFLFPETYNFYMDSSAVQALLRMLREFSRRFTEEYIDRAEHMGYSINEIMTIASLIEREAGDDEERSRIAAVIFNRLNSANFPLLQIDATIDYARIGTGLPFSTDFVSPYNTYLHPGLPPGPIANPGMPSIRAALFPDTTNEYFYALNQQGTHNFFTNYQDHVNFVNSDAYGG